MPYVFLAIGDEILFWDYHNEAYPHPVSTIFKQEDLHARADDVSDVIADSTR